MYRKCVFCGWGRKEVTDTIKFYSLPNTPGLQRLRWLQTLGEKCQNGVRSKDSVCSLHFCTGKPSSDQTHIDFVPTRYLEENSVPSEIVRKSLRNKIEIPKESPPKKAKKHLSIQEEARKQVRRKPKAAKKTAENKREQSEQPKHGAPEATEPMENESTTSSSPNMEHAKPSPRKPPADYNSAPFIVKQNKTGGSPKKAGAKQLPEKLGSTKVFVPKRTQIVKYRKVSGPFSNPIAKTNTTNGIASQHRPPIASVQLVKPNSVAMEVVVDGEDSYSIPISG